MSTGTGLMDTEEDTRGAALESPTVTPMAMSGRRVPVTNKMQASLLLMLIDRAGTFFEALRSWRPWARKYPVQTGDGSIGLSIVRSGTEFAPVY